MKIKSRQEKLLQIVEFHAEARRLAGKAIVNQSRFFEVAAAHGKELEPNGWLAGARFRLGPPKKTA